MSAPNGLSARFRLRRGTFDLDVAFDAPMRGVTALFGPSGSGKTTILRCMAGLERATEGHLRLDGACWQDEASRTFVPSHRRSVGYVFQEASLFPHLSVRGNLEYGLKRLSPERRRITLDDAASWLALQGMLDRKPHGLSGGERQRVAIARSILTSPRILLMDEPLSSLDHESRHAIMPYLEQLHEKLEIPVVYVSHALAEIARLADHMVWLDSGRVRAVGPLHELSTRADLPIGHEDAHGAVLDTLVGAHDDTWHLTALDGPAGRLWVRHLDRPPGTRVRIQLAARDISLALSAETDGSILNVFPATVEAITPTDPSQVLVRLACGVPSSRTALLARITARSASELHLEIGTRVYARVKSVSLMDGPF